MKKIIYCIFLVVGLMPILSCAGDQEIIKESRAEIYNLSTDSIINDGFWVFKRIEGQDLEAYISYPENYDRERVSLYPVVAWFHGGGWNSGEAAWGSSFVDQFTQLGCVAISFDYRLVGGDNNLLDSMEDAHSAIRWIRENAEYLHIDPNKVIASGDSAGGQIALATDMFPQFQDPFENDSISSSPDLFLGVCPALYFLENPMMNHLFNEEVKIDEVNPIGHITGGMVDSYYWVGDQDSLYEALVYFDQFMKEAGNTSALEVYPGGQHEFHYTDPEAVEWIWRGMEEVLTQLEWI